MVSLIGSPERYKITILKFHLNMGSIDGIMFVFALGTEYRIKPEIIESNDMVSLIGSYERSINNKLGGSLDGISQIRNCTWQYLWFDPCYVIGKRRCNFNGISDYSCLW